MDLSEEEIRKILDLIDRSEFDYLELEHGDLKLTVSKGAYVPRQTTEASAPTSPPVAPPAPVPAETSAQAPADPVQDAPVVREGLEPVTSPMVGTFYAAPKPGAPPFVEKGSGVTSETTVGLIEVMKVFTSVSAQFDGVIEEIFVSDSEFVEFGQILFLIRPNGNG